MLGHFDLKDGDPKVILEIKGTRRNTKQIAALFDTGHNGSLSLTIFDLIAIGAKLSSIGEATLADGFKKPQLYFAVKVTIDGVVKDVEASMIENPETTESIAGMELFSNYVAEVNFKNKTLTFTKI